MVALVFICSVYLHFQRFLFALVFICIFNPTLFEFHFLSDPRLEMYSDFQLELELDLKLKWFGNIIGIELDLEFQLQLGFELKWKRIGNRFCIDMDWGFELELNWN